MKQVLEGGRYCGTVLRGMQVAGFHLTETVYVPGTVLEAHSHTHWYLCYVPEGFYHETAEGRTRLCQPRTVAVHPAGETHSERFHQRMTRSFNIQGPGRVEKGECFEGGEVAHLASRVHGAFLDGDALRVESLLYELLGVMKSDESEPLREPPWLREARRLLGETMSDPAPLTSIAARLGVGATHLATAFRRVHHCTAGDYVRRLRVEHACRQIAGGGELAGIALDCGFYDQSHFTRTFRTLMGVTPGEYKAML